MENNKLANEPARKSKDPAYYLTPLLPEKGNIGSLKDMAQEIIAAFAGLESKVARETAIVLGDELRLINSYYSNLIEGHKTTIPDINMALNNRFSKDPEKKYAQELCAAHVETEKPTASLFGWKRLTSWNHEANIGIGQPYFCHFTVNSFLLVT